MSTSTPHAYLKRDPRDLDRSEVEAMLKETLGISLKHARAHERFPLADYNVKGHEFWWSSTFVTWFRPVFERSQLCRARSGAMADIKLNAARAAYERGQL